MDLAGAVVALAAVALAGAGLASWLVAWRAAARRPRVLCLMYHRAAPREATARLRGTERLFTVAEEELSAQLGWLRERGWRFVAAEDVAAHARGERALPDRSLLLTIDDGCASVRGSMLPILQRHDARAALFVTTDPESAVFRIGAGERRLSDGELRELAAAGVEIGSHAVSHRALSALDEAEIRSELLDSKRELERVLGRPVRHFAVPANWYDDRVLRLAREVGYTAVWCSWPGTVAARSGAYPIPRLNVDGGQDLGDFERALSPAGIAARRLALVLRALPKRLVGPRAWSAVRRHLLRGALADWLSPRRMAAAAGVLAAAGLVLAAAWWLGRA
jgi:peptidoglycan/xylan/chitin deacetylase (PgdA/CDA1 family)